MTNNENLAKEGKFKKVVAGGVMAISLSMTPTAVGTKVILPGESLVTCTSSSSAREWNTAQMLREKKIRALRGKYRGKISSLDEFLRKKYKEKLLER